MKLVIGDLYYKKMKYINYKTGGNIYEDSFVRGESFMTDTHETTLATITARTNKQSFEGWNAIRLWETNNEWIHLGPGEIEDYPEATL